MLIEIIYPHPDVDKNLLKKYLELNSIREIHKNTLLFLLLRFIFF